jgi:hypothetical protein
MALYERERERERESIIAYMCIYLCSKFKLKLHTIYLKPQLHPTNYLEAIIVLVVAPFSLVLI